MSKEVVKGHVDLLVLAVLADGPAHGYGVIEALRQKSNKAFDLPEGTIYPLLHRLEKAKLVTSEWSEVSGRRRRTYRLTDRGTVALAEQRSAWESFSASVADVLRGTPWPNAT